MVVCRVAAVLACHGRLRWHWRRLSCADPDPVAAAVDAAAAAPEAAPDGRPSHPTTGGSPSAAPATTKTPDGWTLTISSKDETLLPVAPLTTALSSRDYVVGGTYSAKLTGPASPAESSKVGYQIGCGIDMSTSNGVDAGRAPPA